MLSHLRNLCGNSVQTLKSQKGQGLVEYALILALIAVVVITAVSGIGTQANLKFQKINTELAK